MAKEVFKIKTWKEMKTFIRYFYPEVGAVSFSKPAGKLV